MPSASSLPTVPVFTPAPTTIHSGLDLLASAATAGGYSSLLTPAAGFEPPRPAVTAPGPFNPAASLSPKVVKRILELEFVEMSEVTVDDDIPQAPGRPPAPARLPITDISQWLERYSLLAAVLATRFPEKAPELFAYQATIVRAERNYEGKRWVSYDRQFRREALARKDLNWSVTDSRLYNEAFTGRARAIARCPLCLQDDHSAPYCPKNPDRQWFGWFPNVSSPWQPASPWQPQLVAAGPLSSQSTSGQEICRRFNDGRCKQSKCRFLHLCKECHTPHAWVACPRNHSAYSLQRSRSPHQIPRLGLTGPPAPGPCR